MEVLLIAVVLHALYLHQGVKSAAISSNENMTDTTRKDEVVKEHSNKSEQHRPSSSENCFGTLLAFYNGKWVAVTITQQSNETKYMAQLCKDLGCGRVFVENGIASMNTCLSNCTIINTTLYCTEAAPNNCSNATKVVCVWQAVKLTGGKDRCAGRVALFGTKGWGTVCDDGWNLKGGNVVCTQLGCGTAVNVMAGDFPPGSGPVYIRETNCSGTERNLWQCSTELNDGRDLCGHKEDAAVMCSGSPYVPVTTPNTIETELTNWTTEIITEIAAEDKSGRISPPVLGCVVLSVTLFLLLFSNAAQCAYYKRRNGATATRIISQASQQDNSETSSDSDYERYFNPDSPPPTIVNYSTDHSVVANCNQEQERLHNERNVVQNSALDSDSTSSGEWYENTEPETEKLFNPANNQLHPEHCIQMTPLHNTTEPTKAVSLDSDSMSSGECYENAEVNTEPSLQTLEGQLSLSEQCPLNQPNPQMAENISISKPYSPDAACADDSDSTSSGECYINTETETENHLNPAVHQFYPEPCIQETPLHNTREPTKSESDSFDSDSTSSAECYVNTELYAEACLQTLEGNPSFPEQPSLTHPKPQIAGNSSVSQSYSPDQDDSSTSSEDDYVNVANTKEKFFANSERSVHSSSDSDYDEVSNW